MSPTLGREQTEGWREEKIQWRLPSFQPGRWWHWFVQWSHCSWVLNPESDAGAGSPWYPLWHLHTATSLSMLIECAQRCDKCGMAALSGLPHPPPWGPAWSAFGHFTHLSCLQKMIWAACLRSVLSAPWVSLKAKNKPSLPCDGHGQPHPSLRAEPSKLPCALSKSPPLLLLYYYPPPTSLHPTSGLLSFLTVDPKPVWIIPTMIHFGFEPSAFYKIKQAPANSAIPPAQAIPGSALSWVLLLGPGGSPGVSTQLIHLTFSAASLLLSRPHTPTLGIPFMRNWDPLPTRKLSTGWPSPGYPDLGAGPFHIR